MGEQLSRDGDAMVGPLGRPERMYGFSPEIIEVALTHTQSDKVAAAYARTTFLDRRRNLMQEWAIFCMGG